MQMVRARSLRWPTSIWRETGDLSVWKGIAQDALIMNIDDLLCVGAVDWHPRLLDDWAQQASHPG